MPALPNPHFITGVLVFQGQSSAHQVARLGLEAAGIHMQLSQGLSSLVVLPHYTINIFYMRHGTKSLGSTAMYQHTALGANMNLRVNSKENICH